MESRYTVAKTSVIDPSVDSPEWLSAQIGEIATERWEGYHKAPKTTFKILRGPEGISLLLHTDEKNLRSECKVEGGHVCDDSCMEFFFKPDVLDVNYMNFEFNPDGVLNLSIGAGRAGRTKIMDDRRIFNIVSIANDGDWTLKFYIPDSFLFSHFKTLSPICRANLYKCGNLTDHKHYATWSEIEVENPDYHIPDFFGKLVF